MADPIATPSLAELTKASWKVGLLGFGGPAGQIALMHKVFVDEKRWIDEPRYLHALSYCTLLPGPEAQQLATYVGWLLHGVRGGLIAGGLFVIPGVVVMLGLSWLYAAQGQTPLVAALFYGVKAAVVALSELRHADGVLVQSRLEALARGQQTHYVKEAAERALKRIRSRAQRQKEWKLTDQTRDPTLQHHDSIPVDDSDLAFLRMQIDGTILHGWLLLRVPCFRRAILRFVERKLPR